MTSAPALQPKKKKHNRSLFYRVSAWLHLWLGLVTGLIMVVVCLTGCIWMFHEEITTFLEPETRIAHQNIPVLTPSQLQTIALERYPEERVTYASYKQGLAAYVGMGEGRKPNVILRINPYTGEIVNEKNNKEGGTDFFRMILNGHRFLWLPAKIGRPIVNYSTLVFVIILISGLVMWWPRRWNKSTRKQSFRIKWNGKAKRVNYDLHNILGFYSLLVLAAISLTGIVYGIEWYSKGLYWVTSGGEQMSKIRPQSDTTKMISTRLTPAQAMDLAWTKVLAINGGAKGFYYAYPDTTKPASTISIYTYPSIGQFYDRQIHHFDQYTLAEVKGNKIFHGPYEQATPSDKLRRMNYDIHVGSIWGLPGRLLAFFGSLIGASLPVTGFIIWWGKKKKEWSGKKKRKSAAKATLPKTNVPKSIFIEEPMPV